MTKIFIPSAGPDDWKAFLAAPEKQWARGYSARSLAHAWESAAGLPAEIAAVLMQSPLLEGIEPLLIFPEWKVALPGGKAASQNDLWVLSKCRTGLVSIAIEGKVDEPFGSRIGDWKANASNGKRVRLEYLADVLGIDKPIPDGIYYQLLHRAASAVIEAERFGATQAAMLVHSFSSTDKWFDEFNAFVGIYGISLGIATLATVRVKKGIPLHLGWVRGDKRFLDL